MLKNPISVPVNLSASIGTEPITSIELWSRCLPDYMLCKMGDEIQLDVVYYRREKLFFARAVSLFRYEPLNRELGFILRLKDGEPFGFLRAEMRDADVYFRLHDTVIMSVNGDGLVPARKEQIVEGTPVTFNLLLDDGTGTKLRASRIQLITPVEAVRLTRLPLLGKCNGVIKKLAVKNATGQIRVTALPVMVGASSSFSCVTNLDDANLSLHFSEERLKELCSFRALNALPELVLENVPNAQRRVLFDLIDHLNREQALAADPCFILYEVLEGSASQAGASGGSMRNVRIHKLRSSFSEFEAWKSNRETMVTEKSILKKEEDNCKGKEKEEGDASLGVVGYLRVDSSDCHG